MNPLVSVVIPAYKSEYIREAIKSVVSQTYDNIEVIVCDDSAGDVIESVLMEEAASINLRYFRNEKQLGGRENHLKCLGLASGKYIKFLHDDDVLHPDCIARLVSAMEADNTLALASSKRHLIDSKGHFLPDILATTFPFTEDVVLDGPSVVTFLADHTVNFIGEPSCVLCRRADLVALGEHVSSLNGRVISWVGDLAMYANLLQRGNLALISQALSFFRVSREQFSQLGRDKPGIGNQGHADFRNSIRELGWYQDTQDSKCVSVAPLFGLGSQRFKQVNLLESMHRAKTTAPAEIVTWMEARRLAPFQADLVTPHMEKLSEGSIQIIVVDRESAPEAVSQTLDSIQAFSYHSKLQVHVLAESPTPGLEKRCWSFQLTRGELAKALNQSLAVSSAEWFVVVEAGAELIPSGLLIAAMELANDPECRAICFDEIYRQQDGSLGAAFRPSFNLDYLISFPAGLSKHWLFRRSVVLEAGGFDTALDAALELDLILRLVNVGGLAGWGHISEPLVITQSPALANIEEERLAITRHLHARGYQDAKVVGGQPGRYEVDYGHINMPLISILIECGGNLPKLQRCVESVLETSEYKNFELILVESSAASREVAEWLHALETLNEPKLLVFRAPTGAGISNLLNRAAEKAKGEFLLFATAHIALVESRSLGEIINHAQRPEVGLVGGKLISPEGKIVQASVVLGLGGPAGSPFRGASLDTPGYMQRLQVDQNCSAVTRDFLMIAKDVFWSVGGMSEEGIPDRYIDIDLCLKVREAGYLLVWSPRVLVMLDKEEPGAATVTEQDMLYSRWLPELARDPAYSPNLSLAHPEGYRLADPQLSWRPLDIIRSIPVVLAHPADSYGCGHYRIIQPFNALKEQSVLDGALSQGLMHVTDLERYNPDVIVLQRQIGAERLEAMRRMKSFSRAFKIYELDDYLPNLPMKSMHREKMPKDIVRSLKQGLSNVDRFVVSTEALAEAFREFHSDIRVVENSLDPRWWAGLSPSVRGASPKPRVGWAGGASHTGDLELIFDVVKELAQEVDWIFFGMCPEKLRPYLKEFHPGVSIEQYPEKLASLNLDLALAPVEENLFNECKSNLRLLEYGACGYPVICSNVRCYEGSLPVTRVKNRFKDWVEAIRMHLADRDASYRMGDQLRSEVLSQWMLQDARLLQWRDAWFSSR